VEEAQCAPLVLSLAVSALPSAACDVFSWGWLGEGLVAEMASNVSFSRGGGKCFKRGETTATCEKFPEGIEVGQQFKHCRR